jgi:hypothetical protein
MLIWPDQDVKIPPRARIVVPVVVVVESCLGIKILARIYSDVTSPVESCFCS